jgi:pyruvate formate lyase activating enzyme
MIPTGKIFDIKKYAIHDGPGIRTTVFFSGCPMDCPWCHNPECQLPVADNVGVNSYFGKSYRSESVTSKDVGCTVTADQVMSEILKDRLFYDESGGGVTFSGGEPMMQIDFLAGLLEKCRRNEIGTAVDTSGYAPVEDFRRILDICDIFLYDMKIMDDKKHIEYTGVSNRLILDNLKFLADAGKNINVRIPVIAGITDSDENLGAIAEFLKPLGRIKEINLLPYNKLGEDKARRFRLNQNRYRGETPSEEVLLDKKRMLESFGFTVKIGG